ncbi:hypothetical protein L9F63_026006, partial [Diploptera punctata]
LGGLEISENYPRLPYMVPHSFHQILVVEQNSTDELSRLLQTALNNETTHKVSKSVQILNGPY